MSQELAASIEWLIISKPLPSRFDKRKRRFESRDSIMPKRVKPERDRKKLHNRSIQKKIRQILHFSKYSLKMITRGKISVSVEMSWRLTALLVFLAKMIPFENNHYDKRQRPKLLKFRTAQPTGCKKQKLHLADIKT